MNVFYADAVEGIFAIDGAGMGPSKWTHVQTLNIKPPGCHVGRPSTGTNCPNYFHTLGLFPHLGFIVHVLISSKFYLGFCLLIFMNVSVVPPFSRRYPWRISSVYLVRNDNTHTWKLHNSFTSLLLFLWYHEQYLRLSGPILLVFKHYFFQMIILNFWICSLIHW